MPSFTWAACDVSDNTRKVIDLALAQWAYAASNQGIPIHFSELPCSNGSSKAEIRLFERSASDLPVSPDVDVFGLTLVSDASGKICVIEVQPPCVAQAARIYLLTDNWQSDGLNYGQAAKTVAHELGHAVGLGHAKFCNYDSIMAQSCEPILQGLGPDDVQSIDALVDYVRSYFHQPLLHSQPSPAPSAAGGTTVTYHAGFNLVSGPRGTVFQAATGSAYTLLPGDNAYRTMPLTQPSYDGFGYWVYFPQDVSVQLNGAGGSFYATVADPGKWFLVGNESGTHAMRVIGSDAAFVYDPQAGQYRPSTTLQPGQAAWVRADKNGLIAVASTALSRDQVLCYLNLGSPSSC